MASIFNAFLVPGLRLMSRLPLVAKLLLLATSFMAACASAALAIALPAWSFIGWTACVALAGAWAYLATAFNMGFIGGLKRAARKLEAIEQGRLDAAAPATGSDEIAQLERSMSRMTLTLSSLVAGVRSSSALLEQSGQRLARNYRELAQRTEQQAANLEQTAAGVKQLSSTVTQTAHHAADADSRAGEVRQAAEEGGRSMELAVETVRAIQTDAHRMRDMVTVIDSIAFQTNILALNAAVEAARAGEQGRGFAVVAGEVRRLAGRCAQEAGRIRELLAASQTNVAQGVAGIRTASDGIAGVVDGVRGVAERMTRISAATTEQGAGLAEIASAVTELETITQRNAHMADEAANQAAELRERSATLTRSVGHFRLQQGTAAEAQALVEQAEAAFRDHGAGGFERYITEPSHAFFDRDMYVFALDAGGRYRAFGGQPAKVGTRVQDLPGVRGDALLASIRKQADVEPGWVEYQINNPAAGTLQTKMSYVMRLGDLYVGCGIYQGDALRAA
ncbi:MAG: cache domain-containing protein [Ramlibacter sp.]|nr:cache domain-containing protein [Ramlibacter sp.]